jgi:hypothetical protein
MCLSRATCLLADWCISISVLELQMYKYPAQFSTIKARIIILSS